VLPFCLLEHALIHRRLHQFGQCASTWYVQHQLELTDSKSSSTLYTRPSLWLLLRMLLLLLLRMLLLLMLHACS
jgi:hypothetical protein